MPEDMEYLKEARHSEDAEVVALSSTASTTIGSRRRVSDALASLGSEFVAAIHDSSRRDPRDLLQVACRAWNESKIEAASLEGLANLMLDEKWLSELALLEFLRGFHGALACRSQFVRICDSEDARAAEWAALNCWRLRFREAAPAVCRALQRFEPNDLPFGDDLLQAAAILGVGEDAALLESLAKSSAAGGRVACCTLIRQQFRTESSDLLVPLVEDADRDVREAAVETLCTVGSERHLDCLLKAVMREEIRTRVDLKRFREDFPASTLSSALDSPDESIRRRASWLLSWADDPEESLRKLMTDPSSDVRRNAAYAAGRSGSQVLGPFLVNLLADPSEDVKKASAIAIGYLRYSEGSGAIIKSLKSASKEGQSSLISALAMLGDSSTLDEVLDNAEVSSNEPSHKQLYDACWALALAGGEDAFGRLRSLDGTMSLQCGAAVLAMTGEPSDVTLLQKAASVPSGERDWYAFWRFDELGAVPGNALGIIRDGDRHEGEQVAMCLRHARPKQVDAQTVDALRKPFEGFHSENGYEPLSRSAAAGISLLALGHLDAAQELELIEWVRTLDRFEFAVALCESLARVHEAESWTNLVREVPVGDEIRSSRDVVEFFAAQGLKADASVASGFFGRIAKGHIMSARRLFNRSNETDCLLLDGDRVRPSRAEEALRWWSDRLSR